MEEEKYANDGQAAPAAPAGATKARGRWGILKTMLAPAEEDDDDDDDDDDDEAGGGGGATGGKADAVRGAAAT